MRRLLTLALALLLASPLFGQSQISDMQFSDVTISSTPEGVTDCDDVANLVAWYDATVGITEDVGVTTWADQKGSFDFTQTTDADEPEYVGTCLNGLECVRFDGSTEYMTASEMIDVSGAVAMFMVLRTGTIVTNNFYLGQADGGGQGRTWVSSINIVGNKWSTYIGGGGVHEGTTAVSIEQEYIVAITSDGEVAGDVGVFVDGGSDETSDTGTGEAADGLVALGASRDISGFWEVDIMEMCFYSAVPSAQDRADLFTALNAKWAVY